MINKIHGFTFFELAIVLAILSVVSLLAYPTVKNQLAKYEANQISRILKMSFKQAKMMSYASKNTVSLCLLNESSVNNSVSCDNEQAQALILFFDTNQSNNYEPNQDLLIDKQDLDLTYGSVELKAGRRKIVQFWQDTGMPRGYFGHIKYCSTYNNAYSFQFSFSQMGRTTLKQEPEYNSGCL